jgi:hypothetical protein
MAFIDQKTDWGVDAVGSADFNRIEGNIAVLHAGNGLPAGEVIQTLSAPAGEGLILDIGTEFDVFKVVDETGNFVVQHITTTGRNPGNRIILLSATEMSRIRLYSSAGAVSGVAEIVHSGITGYLDVDGYSSAMLIYTGTYWQVL